MFEQLSTVGFTATIVAGFVAVFLPCNFPMLVGYIALLVGDEKSGNTLHVLRKTFWFFVGFAVTYAIFGSAAGLFGQFSKTTLLFNQLKPLIVTAGGLFFIIIGLILLRFLPLPAKLQKLRSIPLPKSISVYSWWGAVLAGVIFATAWSPCIGPVLGGILLLAAASGSVLSGAFLLLLFAFSMMIPLAFVAVVYSQAARRVAFMEKFIPFMRVAGGIAFILLGLSFFLGFYF